MTKKKARKKKKKKAGIDISKLPPKVLAKHAKQHTETGDFIRAIEIYKHLAKKEPAKDRTVELKSAYRGRVLQLAGKGMHCEALAIFDNMAAICKPLNEHSLYLTLLLNSAHYLKAAKVYSEHASSLDKKKRGRVDTFFAALLISGNPELAQALPVDSPPMAHYNFALAALNSYDSGEYEQTEKSLSKIPFKSPYKDFRFALKAMILRTGSEPDKAAGPAVRVLQDSPFHCLAAPCALTSDEKIIAALSSAKGINLDYLAGIHKIPLKTASFITGLDKAFESMDRLFDFIMSHCTALDSKIAARLCYHLLPHLPGKIKKYEKTFGSLSGFEINRLKALNCETVNNDLLPAITFWRQALKNFKQIKNKDNNLTRALILRHIAGLMEKMPGNFSHDDIIESLEQSLKFVPDHKPTHLKLLEMNRNEKGDFQHAVDRALKVLPKDIDILLAAIKAAASKNAFKKAGRFAADLLKIDPINTRRRTLLINAHLNHGRKLARAGKLVLAGKEFEEAVSLDRSNLAAGVPCICFGVTALLEDDNKAGRELFKKGRRLAGSEAAARLAVAAEARIMKAPGKLRKQFDNELKELNKRMPAQEDISILLNQAQRYIKDNQGDFILPALNLLTPYLKKCAKFDFSRDEFQGHCKFFHEHDMFGPLKAFAASAEKYFPGAPAFVYYRIYAMTQGGRRDLSDRSFDQLDNASDQAEAQQDFKTVELIEELLHGNLFGRNVSGPMPSPGELMDVFNAFFGKLHGDDFDDDDDDDEDYFLPLPKQLREIMEKRANKKK